MNIEEAKAFLEANGYFVRKKKSPVPKFLPCVCGHNRRVEWYVLSRCGNGYEYECTHCGFKGGVGKTRLEAREKWNETVNKLRSCE